MEFLPESPGLLHLDLTANSGLDLAGLLALSGGLKGNWVMRCLDVDVPVGDEECARVCREILNTCIRNTEEAERVANARRGGESSVRSTPSSNLLFLPLWVRSRVYRRRRRVWYGG